MIRWVMHWWYAAAYYFSWGSFMAGGLVLSVCSLPLLPWRGRRGIERGMRTLQRALFRIWTAWFAVSGIVRITWTGFEKPLTPGTIYVSTHPTLIDAPMILGRLPDSVCVVKPGVLSNPALGAASIMAGFVTGADGVDMVRLVAEKIRSGQALLVFPEGTRTEVGAVLNPFKPGFALIANRAQARVQLILTRSTPGFVTRGRAWWRLPAVMPARMSFTLDRAWDYDATKSPVALSDEIEAHVRQRLRELA